MAERVVIERLGARADGIGHRGGHAVYVPYGLPGEAALVEGEGSRAQLVSVETPSPDRVAPFCPYFGRCGGCLTQHMAWPVYAGWKRAILIDALGQAGLDAPVEALVDAHGAGRRRITLHARFEGGKPRVGYMRVRSHELIEIAFCPIAEPALKEAPRTALALAEPLAAARKPLDIQLTATETGLDVDLRGHGELSERERQALIAVAGRHDLARLSLHGDVLVERRAPLLRIARRSSRRRRAASCRRPRPGRRRSRASSSRRATGRSGSPTSSPAAAPSRCVSPSAPRSRPSTATRARLPPLTRPRAKRRACAASRRRRATSSGARSSHRSSSVSTRS